VPALVEALGLKLDAGAAEGEELPPIVIEMTALKTTVDELKAFPLPPRLSQDEVMVLNLQEMIKKLEADLKEKEDFIRRLQTEKMTLRSENIKLKNDLPDIKSAVAVKVQRMSGLQKQITEVVEHRTALEEICAVVSAKDVTHLIKT
jgi:chromosome segregation ATPase